MGEIKGLGLRRLCPDCGRVVDKAQRKMKDPVTGRIRRYHSPHCEVPLVRCTVGIGEQIDADRLDDALEKAERIEPQGSAEWVESGVAMRTTVLQQIREAVRS